MDSPRSGGHGDMRGSVWLQAVTEISTLDAMHPPQPWAEAPQAAAGARLNRFGPSARRWRALAKGFQASSPPSDSIEWRLRSRAGRPLGWASLGQRWCQVVAEATHVLPSVPRGPTECVQHVGTAGSPHPPRGALPAHCSSMQPGRQEGSNLLVQGRQLLHLFHCTTAMCSPQGGGPATALPFWGALGSLLNPIA